MEKQEREFTYHSNARDLQTENMDQQGKEQEEAGLEKARQRAHLLPISSAVMLWGDSKILVLS